MINLLGLDAPHLTHWFAQQGEKPFRAHQVMRWMHRRGASNFEQMTDVAKSLRAKLVEAAEIRGPNPVRESIAADGTRKWLMDVDVGNAIETVFIPEEDRGTLCISTQAGCALECAFCSTGQQGFNRNLTAAEIIGQLWVANQSLGAVHGEERVISNVVLMGMGEPLANFENVVSALSLMLDDHAYGLSRRRVTVSTVGIVPAMDRLRDTMPVALAVSLHASTDALRDQLVPLNKKYPLRDLMAACERYLAKSPRDFITFEYALLADVNDADDQARALLSLTQDIPCKFNLIPFNPFSGSSFRRPRSERVRRFQEILIEAGKIATVRKTRGSDIEAACGQLAGRVCNRKGESNGRRHA